MVDVSKAFDASENGVLLSDAGGDLYHVSSGADVPTHQAPFGSRYFRTNGEEYKKTGALATDWTIAGIESTTASLSMNFGKNGNVSNNTYIPRTGGVSSNIIGLPVLLNNSFLRAAEAQNEDTTTFDLEIFKHDGNGVNLTVIHTIEVVSANGKLDSGLNISVETNKQIGCQITGGSAKNIGVSLIFKGTSL